MYIHTYVCMCVSVDGSTDEGLWKRNIEEGHHDESLQKLQQIHHPSTMILYKSACVYNKVQKSVSHHANIKLRQFILASA